jgi:predicted HTH transcriptional regulator
LTTYQVKRILQLISQGEGEQLDFKKEISNSSRIARSIVSFANHKGGTLLIGVNDDGTIAGVKAEEEKFMLEQAAVFFCRPEIHLEVHEWTIRNKVVMEVLVPEGKDKPYYAKDEQGKWCVHIRVADQSLLASKVVVDVLKRSSTDRPAVVEFSSKEKALLDYLREHSKITIKQYCKLINISRWRAIKIVVNLVSIGVIRSHTTEKTEFFTLS